MRPTSSLVFNVQHTPGPESHYTDSNTLVVRIDKIYTVGPAQSSTYDEVVEFALIIGTDRLIEKCVVSFEYFLNNNFVT